MDCIELLRELIRFDTVNPPGNEKPTAQCLTRLLQTAGFRCEVQDLDGNRVDLIVVLGGGDGPELMLAEYLDVVPAVGAWDNNPFSMAEKDGRLYGRGTSGMKGGIAAMCEAAMGCAARKEPMKESLKLLFATDEECSSLGTLSYLETHEGSGYAIMGEPTRLEVATVHRGVSKDYIDIKRAPRHAALPAGEEDAVMKACRAVLAVDDMNEALRHITHPVLPPLGIAVTMIEGYEKDSVVPKNVYLLLGFRIHPDMDHKQVGRFLDGGFEQAGTDGCQRTLRYYIPDGEIHQDDRFVKLCLEGRKRLLGIKSFPQPFEASCEQCFLTEQGIRTVTCGSGDIAQTHTMGEFTQEKQVQDAVELCGRIIDRILYKTKYNWGEIMTMKDVYETLREKRITLPQPPVKGGVYTLVQEFGDEFLYYSGCGLDLGNGNTVVGKLGEDLTVEESQKVAYSCMLNPLANLNDRTKDLNRIKRFAKALAFMNSVDDFGIQPQVVNEGSNLIVGLFGEEAGLPTRSAIGANALSGGIACEIEALVELKQKRRQQRES